MSVLFRTTYVQDTLCAVLPVKEAFYDLADTGNMLATLTNADKMMTWDENTHADAHACTLAHTYIPHTTPTLLLSLNNCAIAATRKGRG